MTTNVLRTAVSMGLAASLLLAAPAPARAQESKLVKFYLGLLVAGPNRTHPAAEAEIIQKAHLAHLEGLVTSGKAVIVGPMGDNGRVLGIEVLRAATPEEARTWTEADPAVKAGRLAVEIYSWYAEDGIMKPVWSTTDLEMVYFGFLKKGPKWSAEKTPESADIQTRHLAHLEKAWKAGKLVIAGPGGDNGDIRGVIVYKTPTIEEALTWANADPAVEAGRLAVDMHPWYVARGALPSGQ